MLYYTFKVIQRESKFNDHSLHRKILKIAFKLNKVK